MHPAMLLANEKVEQHCVNTGKKSRLLREERGGDKSRYLCGTRYGPFPPPDAKTRPLHSRGIGRSSANLTQYFVSLASRVFNSLGILCRKIGPLIFSPLILWGRTGIHRPDEACPGTEYYPRVEECRVLACNMCCW